MGGNYNQTENLVLHYLPQIRKNSLCGDDCDDNCDDCGDDCNDYCDDYCDCGDDDSCDEEQNEFKIKTLEIFFRIRKHPPHGDHCNADCH